VDGEAVDDDPGWNSEDRGDQAVATMRGEPAEERAVLNDLVRRRVVALEGEGRDVDDRLGRRAELGPRFLWTSDPRTRRLLRGRGRRKRDDREGRSEDPSGNSHRASCFFGTR